jgi:arsenical pump membrane protein
VSTAASLVILAAVLLVAAARPFGLPEAAGAVPGAVLVVATGLVPWVDALHELARLGPTVGFLAAVLVLSHVADEHGVFAYAGSVAARLSRGSPPRFLAAVFLIASSITAVLSLDATVVLLTPVVLNTATAIGVRRRPHVHACAHLANSASLLLPMSNLTNLLAFAASGLSFAGFAGLMALPWLAVIGVEYLIFRWFFTEDLSAPSRRDCPPPSEAPRFALVVLAATLAGFGIAELIGVHPAWVATAGAVVLAAGRLVRSPLIEARRLILAARPVFAAFVLALGVVVLAVRGSNAGGFIARLTPGRAGILGLLVAAGLAAVLANLLNNLPAGLMLVPLVAHSPGLVLAVLVGLNIGPNLTYVGSLATLLWRQILLTRGYRPATGEFLRLGAATVPAGLAVGVAALWLGLRLSGTS